MQKSLFPSEILEYTSETIYSKYSPKSHIVYCTIILSVAIVLALLPVIKISVSVQSSGIIRPITEKNEIKLLVPGTISKIFINENQRVSANEIILQLNTDVLDEKIRLFSYQKKEKNNFVHDLKLLTSVSSNTKIDTAPFKTMHYKNEYFFFKNQLEENSRMLQKAKKESDRYSYLHKEKLSSLSELEYKKLEVSQRRIKHNLIIEQQLGNWYKDLLENQLKLKELSAEYERLTNERSLYTIKSPTAGTIEQFSGFSVGSYVQSGQLIAVISPDNDLILEVSVSPKDIGLLGLGTTANIQIDAFNYNQWGLITGKIKSISNDFIIIDNQPVFRVKCSLSKTFLQLKNGYVGNLKKGMTVRARFLITERSIYQLLFDKVDDWLNPLQKQV